jgi:predicted dehydrogenase
MNSPLRVALIGSGMMGSLHARVLSQHLRTDLAVVVDPDAERGLATAEAWGTHWAAELDDIESYDAMVVATPSQHHLEWAVRGLEAGLSVLVEKPLSQDHGEVEHLVGIADKLDLPLQCGLLERFNPAVMKACEIVEEPIHISVMRHSPHTPRITTGVAYDLSIHDVDLALRMTGEYPARIDALMSVCHTASPADSEDIAEIILGFPSGTIAALSASRVSQRKLRTLQVAERDRLVEVDLLRRDITVYHHVGSDYLEGRNTGYRQQTVIDIPAITDAREPLAAQLDHFIALAEGLIDPVSERAGILPPHRVIEHAIDVARGPLRETRP